MKRVFFAIFFLFLHYNLSSQNCLGSQSYTLTPAGPYSPGQTVTVTYTLSQFIQVNVNWIIAFDIDYGNGWVNISPVSAPGNPGGSTGSWVWDNQHTYPSGLNFGPGYRFVNSGWNSDWGTSSTGPFTLSFNLTVGNSCINNDLSINISVIGDCQTGGWNNGACCSINPFSIYSGTSSGGAGNIIINETITPISCNGASDGSIDLNISGGTAPYTINWSNNSSSSIISGLNAGNYFVNITDNIGCIINESYNLIDPPLYSPNIVANNISCNGYNDGSISVLNEPNTTTYLWSNFDTTSSINNLTPGNYAVDVTNANGCVLSQFFTIIEPTQLNVNISSNNISCYGANDGNIDLVISGGNPNYIIDMPPYYQVLNNGATNFFSQAILSPGLYNYIITDSSGCIYTDTISINEPNQITTNPIITNVLCNNQSNGSIILNTDGGTYPYTEDFGGFNPLALTAGNYNYTILDANGCFFTDSFIITEPDSLISNITTTNATCATYSDGTVSLNITGGSNPYNINWFGNNPNSLAAGTYNYIITDNNGCINQGTATIYEPPGMALNIDTFRVSCYGGNDGIALLNISGGAGSPYNTNWGGLNSNSLPAGNHIVTVTDINNCSITDTAFITQPSEIIVNEQVTNVSCFGEIDGSVTLDITGGIFPYTQNWFNIDSSHLAPGNYMYQITDYNNCTINGNVTILEPEVLTANAIITNVNCFGYSNGAANMTITGGTQPYITDFGTYDQYALPAGTFPFTITDANGCTYDSTVSITQLEEIYLDFIATSPICRYEESTLSIHISNSNTNTYTINLEDSVLKSFVIDTNGILLQEGTPIILKPNYSGKVYITSVTDNFGCTTIFNDNVHIEVNQLPIINLNEDDICIGESSYNLENATPLGGTYFINNIMTNYFDVENLLPGPYNIKYEYEDPLTSCYNEIEEVITISESPHAEMLYSPQPTDMNNPNIYFRDNSNEEVISSEWDLGDNTIIYNDLQFWHTYDSPGTYTVKYYITNQYNCTDSVIKNIIINPIYQTTIPSAFTPNNDGENDLFAPSFLGSKRYNIKIFDRWGGIIFNEDNIAWDGKLKNNKIESGVYSYSITVYDYKNKPYIYTGLVSLLK